MEQGITPVYTAVGTAGAVYRYLNEANQTQTVENAVETLQSISGLSPEHPLTALIMESYNWFLNGDSPAVMRRSAERKKFNSQNDVI